MYRPIKLEQNIGENQTKIQNNKNLNKWVIFPEALPTQRFGAYEVREDFTQNRGKFVIGQNMTFNNARIPTLRNGYEVISSEATDSTPVKRAWLFETRDGAQWEIKAYGTTVYGRVIGVMSDFILLKGGFTSGLDFGYANIGKTADTTTHTYFCNGTEDFYRFNGAYTTVASSAANTITLPSGTWTALGFYTSESPRSVIIEGVEYAYTGGEGTTTLTGVTPDASGITVGAYAVQSPFQLSGGTTPIKGQVMMAHDGRLHARNEAKKDVWNYSKLDDPNNFSTGSSDGDGGAKEVEFGGPITAFGKLNKTALCFKNRIIKALSFNQVGARLDSPVYTTLIPADDKGTSLGAINQKSTFSTPLGQVFITPDKRMVLLSGVTANNEPQYLFLSDPIQPVMTQGVHDEGTGICVDNIVWYSFKSDINSTYNDVVIRGDLTRQTITSEGKVIPVQWDTPYIGWNVADWTVVYREDLGKNEVHWHSSINSSSYRIIDNKADNNLPYTGILRTWNESFGEPNSQKKIDYVYLEVEMSPLTELNVTLLYDEDGCTDRDERVLKAIDATNQSFNSSFYNPFGASAYGSQPIGSNPAESVLKKYRFMIETPNNTFFYNLALQISVIKEANDFKLIRWGARVTEVMAEPDKKLKI